MKKIQLNENYKKIISLIPKDSTVLDLGCGRGNPFIGSNFSLLVGVDLFKKKFHMPEHDLVLYYDIKNIDSLVSENSFDTIVLIDTIEHLKKEEGIKLLKDCEKIGKKKVIVFTPNIWTENQEPTRNSEMWSYKNPYNLHKSLWKIKDFTDLGYSIIPCQKEYILAEKRLDKEKQILLPNWTHRSDRAGGAETVYFYLKKVFPNAELISGTSLFSSKKCQDLIKELDNYLIMRYKNNKNMIVIRDAEFGGILDISMIPQIAVFGNPYKAISEQVLEQLGIEAKVYDDWLIDFSKKINVKKKIATSNFMANEMKKVGLKTDYVIPNCVDTDVFKPVGDKKTLRTTYTIPQDKKVGIWVGSDTPVKNFQMLSNLISCFQNIFWILVTKDNFKIPFENTKIFYNIDSKTLNDLHNCADFFILTSPIEGCGIAALEAMSANVPCILSKAGYFWDFWDKRIGLQVDWNNFDEHADAIQNIDKIKTNSREVILERKLDYTNWEKQWKEVVDSL